MKLFCADYSGSCAVSQDIVCLDCFDADFEIIKATGSSAETGSEWHDISSIENWDKYSDFLRVDYKVVREEIMMLTYTKLQTTGWDSLTSDEKEIATRWFVLPKYLRDLVYSTEEQIQLGLDYHNNSVAARQLRLARATMEVYNRLEPMEAQEIINDMESANLSYTYIQFGKEGLEAGDAEGIFDYIQGTVSSSYSGSGMVDKDFTPEGMTMQQLTTQSMDILKNGNY